MPSDLPLVLQCNKRDMPDTMDMGAMREQLGLEGVPTYAAVASTGEGVFETFRGLGKLVMARIGGQQRVG